jgi:hypothetical protein
MSNEDYNRIGNTHVEGKEYHFIQRDTRPSSINSEKLAKVAIEKLEPR